MGNEEYTNTPYDDVFRTLLNDCSELILPVLNETFGEHYTGREKIVFRQNEHFLGRQDGEEDKRITDSSFTVTGETEKRYHLECQSIADRSMLIRMFEYDSQIALEGGELETEDMLSVRFPHSAVLYLRSTDTTPDRYRVRIVVPDGRSITYEVPTLKIRGYGIEEIFEKRLLFLIPFYIFVFEKQLPECDDDAKALVRLQRVYLDIYERLDALAIEGVISEYTKRTICDMSGRVVVHIARRYSAVQEGVKAVMGGRVLDYEAKTILNRGREEGREEGRLEGRQEGCQEGGIRMLVALVRDGLITVRDASVRACMTEQEFTELLQAE